MTLRSLMKATLALFAALICFPILGQAQEKGRPNIILIFTDDQGYGDVGCYGAKGYETPNMDRMAKEGIRFTSFYTGCPVCSGSRAALLTACYYQRVSVRPVFFPPARNGLNPNEITIAEILKEIGYTTGMIGKWHLGHLPPFLPTAQGFDSYYGIPYSNDMWLDKETAQFAKDCVFLKGMTEEKARTEKRTRNWVPLMRGTKVVEYPADQSTLTKRYTEEAMKFIEKNKKKPFFLYMPHTMPHVPMFVSKKFQNKTKSLYGNVIEELDWSVGEVLKTVKKCGIDKKTLVIFTTDNGTHRGSSGPLRGRKAGPYEGGVRVPCIMRWPGRIEPGTKTNETAATIDILPTIAKITGAKVPQDRTIDGKDISPLVFGEPGAKTPHEYYILLHRDGCVRSGKWKYYPWPEGGKKKNKKGKKGKKGKKPAPVKRPKVQLYDLSTDLSETKNVAEQHPQVVRRLHAAFVAHRMDIRKNKRPAGTVNLKKKQ
ncbi:MAG: sulfatase [Gemmataceae bacterium]